MCALIKQEYAVQCESFRENGHLNSIKQIQLSISLNFVTLKFNRPHITLRNFPILPHVITKSILDFMPLNDSVSVSLLEGRLPFRLLPQKTFLIVFLVSQR